MEKLDSVLVILVKNLKGTVTLTTIVEKVSDVDQTIAWLPLDLMHTQIAVMIHLLDLRIFAQPMNLVKWMKVTVILMTNVKAICFVDQTIVLVHSGFYLQLIAVNQKVINTCYVLAIVCCITQYNFFQILPESCAMNYCQDGLQVYFATETQEYFGLDIYGHYELQANNVNSRPYFKMGWLGLWWDGVSVWWIGPVDYIGQPVGYAYYDKDVFCPSQLSDWNWVLFYGDSEYFANNDLGIDCKCIFIQT